MGPHSLGHGSGLARLGSLRTFDSRPQTQKGPFGSQVMAQNPTGEVGGLGALGGQRGLWGGG